MKDRRPKRAHRRRQTEPRRPFVVSRNPPKLKPVVTLRNPKPPRTPPKTTLNPSTINVPSQANMSTSPKTFPGHPTELPYPSLAPNGQPDQQWFPYIPLWLPLNYLEHFRNAPLMKVRRESI